MMPAIARRISRQLSPEGAELPAGSVSVGGRVTFGVPVAPPTPPSGVGVGVGLRDRAGLDGELDRVGHDFSGETADGRVVTGVERVGPVRIDDGAIGDEHVINVGGREVGDGDATHRTRWRTRGR